MSFFSSPLKDIDNEIHQAINLELDRQQNQIELIASENIVSKAVLEAQGSIMTNKYAEGLPFKRYYGGCEVVDEIEDLARERAKELGCSSIHTHTHEDGSTLYMPCESMEAYEEKKNGTAGYGDGPSCPPGKEMRDGRCVEMAVTLEIEIDEIATSIEASTGSTVTQARLAPELNLSSDLFNIASTFTPVVDDLMISANSSCTFPFATC